MKLYEISAMYRQCIEQGFAVDEETGEYWTGEEALNSLEGEFVDKAEACAVVIKEKKAEAAAIAAEIKRLQERKKSLENEADRLADYVARNMHALDVSKVNTSKAVISFRKSQKCVVLDAEELPAEYVKTEKKPMLDSIKKAIKSGQDVPGAIIEESQNLQIK